MLSNFPRDRHLTVVLLSALLAGCGAGGDGTTAGSGASASSSSSAPGNVVSAIVDAGPAGTVNALFVTVTLCVPGSSNCTAIDHVLVDTGSTGLRVVASLLPSGMTLPPLTNPNSAPLFECLPFADGYSWGSVRSADVRMGGESAAAMPVQIVGEASAPPVPADCPNGSPPENSVQTLGANGILGVGVFREDCGAACVGSAVARAYYGCSAGSCVASTAALAQQVQNPVYRFAVDNNGVQIQLPAIGAAGALGANGSLLFGIDTQSNNQLGTATVLRLDPTFGSLATLYQGRTLANSVIDSGSNALFFADANLPQCSGTLAPGFYCPTTAQTLSASLQSVAGVLSTVSFAVANSEALLKNNPAYAAYQNLAGNNASSQSFVWGLPFFYGRHIYFAIEGQATSAGMGPFVAY